VALPATHAPSMVHPLQVLVSHLPLVHCWEPVHAQVLSALQQPSQLEGQLPASLEPVVVQPTAAKATAAAAKKLSLMVDLGSCVYSSISA
jgi:hypothetical protein